LPPAEPTKLVCAETKLFRVKPITFSHNYNILFYKAKKIKLKKRSIKKPSKIVLVWKKSVLNMWTLFPIMQTCLLSLFTTKWSLLCYNLAIVCSTKTVFAHTLTWKSPRLASQLKGILPVCSFVNVFSLES